MSGENEGEDGLTEDENVSVICKSVDKYRLFSLVFRCALKSV